ncbi:MAG: DNA polymerase I [Prevotella sp.]|nr:DNA polymerase I [Prevotella sp.]
MNKLFLLDAYALIYRSYYAFINSPRINSKGLNTSAIMGFCNTLFEVLSKEHPSHIAVAFDPKGKTFRHVAYKEYKAQRQEAPEAIHIAVPVIKEILNAMKICSFEVDGFEADDVIGTIALKAGNAGVQTYMLTPDKDYGQLVKENVFMFRPRHGGGYETLDSKGVCDKYGISSPLQVIDLLGLMGDASDNIPGCPGVGEKTAIKLINQFGSIDSLLERTSELKGALKTKIESNVEKIRFSKFLATIRTDVPVELNLDALKVTEPDASALRKIFDELEFKTLANRFLNKPEISKKNVEQQLDLFATETHTDTEVEKEKTLKTLKDTPHTYKLIDKEEDMKNLCDFFLTKSFISLDTETTSTNAINAELVGLSFSVEESKAFYVPVPPDRKEAQEIVDIFKPLYENPEILKIGQNIKYDIEVLANYGVHLKGEIFDTMIAHYLIQPEISHNMDYMAEVYLDYKTVHIDELIGPKGKNQGNMRDLPPEQVYEYAAEDADITLRLKNEFVPMLEKVGVQQLFHDIEMPLIPVLAKMEMNGVRIDTKSLAETSQILTQRMKTVEKEIYEIAGKTFNISSPKQVGEVLYVDMHIIEKPKKTKTGQFSTSEEVLKSLKNKNIIVGKILEHRGLKKLLSTYIDSLPSLINPRTGHIHTSFNQMVTATGRLSSSNPNLQNIPVRGEDGKEIRKAFIPDDGCLFFSADYSQIELRVMAHLSRDENMIKAFREGYDIHAATAARINKVEINNVTRDMRSKAKRANFGIIYGITAFGLAEQLGISRSEANQLINHYFATFPMVEEYIRNVTQQARQKGYVETFFHRRRYLPNINSRNANVRGLDERNAINAPIQGSAADIIKVAMVNIHRRFMAEGIKSKMILQVHDELNFSVLPEEKEKVEKIVLEEMQNAYPLLVPLVADSGWGQNWLEAH